MPLQELEQSKNYLREIRNTITECGGSISATAGLKDIPEGTRSVFEAGKQAEYDAFWDNLQKNGNRTSYAYAFYNTYWNNITYKPKYPILLKSGGNVFSYAAMTDTLVDIDVSQATTPANITYVFQNNTSIKTIRKIIVNENTSYLYWFTGCTALKNITFEGIIGKSINFAQSPLTLDSAISVITHLLDLYTIEGEYTQTVTFSKSTWDLLDNTTQEQLDKAIKDAYGWDNDGLYTDWRSFLDSYLGWSYA